MCEVIMLSADIEEGASGIKVGAYYLEDHEAVFFEWGIYSNGKLQPECGCAFPDYQSALEAARDCAGQQLPAILTELSDERLVMQHQHGQPCPLTGEAILDNTIFQDTIFTDHDRPGLFNACASCHSDSRGPGQRLQELENARASKDG